MFDVQEILLSASAAVVALGVIWRSAVRPVVRGVTETAHDVRGVRELLEPDEDGKTIPQRLADLENAVAVIDHRSKQLEPNGGNSLYDRVGKLELGQQNAMRQQQTFTKKLTPMVETIATLAGPPRRTAPMKKKES